jgi:hypothetical protein
MIIFTIHLKGITVLNLECDSPVPANFDYTEDNLGLFREISHPFSGEKGA